MAANPVDILRHRDRLKAVGISADAAEAHVVTVLKMITELDIATSTDLRETATGLRSDVGTLKVELKTEMLQLRSDLLEIAKKVGNLEIKVDKLALKVAVLTAVAVLVANMLGRLLFPHAGVF